MPREDSNIEARPRDVGFFPAVERETDILDAESDSIDECLDAFVGEIVDIEGIFRRHTNPRAGVLIKDSL